MDLTGWNQRYRSGERAREDLLAPPTPLVMETVQPLPPGSALDLACGSGRNSLWLGERGWRVTAVDGAEAAIQILRERSAARGLPIEAVVADLQSGQFTIQPDAWDLILMAYYLQRDLFDAMRAGVKPGGIAIAIVHVAETGEEPTAHRASPGELAAIFPHWEILHYYEGPPADEAHRRSVAQIVAKRPPVTSSLRSSRRTEHPSQTSQ